MVATSIIGKVWLATFAEVCVYPPSDISKNRLLEIPPELIEHGQSLEELDVYHNSIRNIPDSIHQLRNLTFLNLRSDNARQRDSGVTSLEGEWLEFTILRDRTHFSVADKAHRYMRLSIFLFRCY